MPPVKVFKPAGVPSRDLENIVLTHEEFEALRLGDLEGLSQEEGAERMGTSRATFGRIINSAHRKTAQAIVEGKALIVEGDSLHVPDEDFDPDQCHRRGRGRRGCRGR